MRMVSIRAAPDVIGQCYAIKFHQNSASDLSDRSGGPLALCASIRKSTSAVLSIDIWELMRSAKNPFATRKLYADSCDSVAHRVELVLSWYNSSLVLASSPVIFCASGVALVALFVAVVSAVFRGPEGGLRFVLSLADPVALDI
ncbi:hypothetical protein C8J57DRAFT_1713350 [Mycena rebaudengoi]|nr:hypothetical protein C8J57DRAFT_1713350 [Mycena rebaudengoi]